MKKVTTKSIICILSIMSLVGCSSDSNNDNTDTNNTSLDTNTSSSFTTTTTNNTSSSSNASSSSNTTSSSSNTSLNSNITTSNNTTNSSTNSNSDDNIVSNNSDTNSSSNDTNNSISTSTNENHSTSSNTQTTPIDNTPPVITISGDNPLKIAVGDNFSDLGATAIDDIDGEVVVTSIGTVDTSTIGDYNITYTAIDNAGNEANAIRVVQVIDNIPPVITISGDNPLEVTQGDTFSDPGATATDNIDGEVAVTPIGSVDMSVVGDYNITYTATDSAGNEANTTRVVTVLANEVIWNVSNVTEFRQALEDASANGENDKIVLSAGVYNVDSDGLGTFSFDDNEEFNLTITSAEGLNRDDVILDGNNTCQVFNFDNTQNSTLILKGISIVDGNNSSSYGGGVYTNHNIKIDNCKIYNNIATAYYDGIGGGFYSRNSATITNSNIYDNYANNSGGGFYSYSTTTLINSTVSNNSSYNNGAFGSYGTTVVKNSIINKNYARHNQGGFGSSGETSVIDSNISNNKADGAAGGFGSNRATTVMNSIISDNNSSSSGGFWSNGMTTIEDSTISNNIVSGSSGGFNSNGTTTIINSLIINNKGKDIGGGFTSDGFTLIKNSKLYNNSTVNRGGGFYTSDTIVITNSILVNNSANYGGSFYSAPYGGYPYPNYNSYLSNNIFIENNGSIYAQGVFVNNIFKDNRDIDINLIGNSKLYNNYIDYTKIEDNGYNVIKKHNLQPSSVGDVYLNDDNETLASNSPVIDKGLNPSSATYREIIGNDNIYNQMVELLTTDKIGNARIYNETIDMGAVEYGSSR